MSEVEQILYELGYYANDDLKKEQIKRYISEAEEFIRSSGVSSEMLNSNRAYAVKFLWSEARDKGEISNMLSRHGVIVQLVAQLRG